MTLNAGMKEVFRRARKVASLDCNVLLVGDTGTGKELIAREIHRAGNKDEDQFYGVNCPGLNENLFEAELFGFREGSFTGANEDREGFFQKASGGTLLLDEIGSLDRGLQSKLLRVLEEETFYRVGDVEAIKETPRIIAATNKSPQTLIEDNSFRRDLYYRLNVVELRLPPLRNREEDILPLTNYFIKTYNGVYDRNVKGLTKPVNQCFRRYSWPGNVRELKNAIEGAVIFADGPLIEKTDLPSSVRGLSKETNPADATFSQLVREYKKEIIKSAISRAGGNRKEAAENLEIDRSTIYRNVDEESESK